MSSGHGSHGYSTKPRVGSNQVQPKTRRDGGGDTISHRSHVDSGNQQQPVQRKVIGQYMLGKTIGEGTFGKVKIAIHLPTGEKVAVKILEKNRIKEQADVRRVNREIKILKKARHGNIIQLYEVLDTPNTIYLMMENAEGGEMFDYIVAHRYVPEMQACKFFHQIVDGVEMLHNNDITHRDLKPENLLLKHTGDGWVVKIVDFGLSNTHEGGKLLSTACGSPCYAAPEMIAGKQYVGPIADIWSMGVILFALVCGFLPFEDANTSNLYRKILAGDYKPAKWISSDVKDLIRRILETDPKRRYSVDDIRKHQWYNLVSEQQIPRDISDNEKIKTETMEAMLSAGIDVQSVLDGISSHTCNSITAMYYLLVQKSRGNKKITIDKDKIQNLISQNKNSFTANANNSAKVNTNGSALKAPNHSTLGSGLEKPQNQSDTNRRSRTPTPTREKKITNAPIQLNEVNQEHDLQAPNRSTNEPRQPGTIPNGQSPRVLQGSVTNPYQQGGSSVLQKLQLQHQQRMNNSIMPSLDVYMGATGSGNDGTGVGGNNRMGKVGVPIIPKLNIRNNPTVKGKQDKNSLVSQTSRPRSVTGASKGSSNATPTSYSARDPLPLDTPYSFNVDAISSELAVIPMPAELLGPMPDLEIDRPSTRRSRLRSRGGDNAGSDERPQSAAGGLDVPHDTVTNAAPVIMHNPDGTEATSTLKVVQAAPDASTRSSAISGGRKGKHIKVISQDGGVLNGMDISDTADPFPTDPDQP